MKLQISLASTFMSLIFDMFIEVCENSENIFAFVMVSVLCMEYSFAPSRSRELFEKL